MESDIPYTAIQCMVLKQVSKVKGVCKMREKYETPEMEVIEFETEDVITTSGVGGVDDPVIGDQNL